MKNKLISFSIGIALIISFTACGESQQESEAKATQEWQSFVHKTHETVSHCEGFWAASEGKC